MKIVRYVILTKDGKYWRVGGKARPNLLSSQEVDKSSTDDILKARNYHTYSAAQKEIESHTNSILDRVLQVEFDIVTKEIPYNSNQ